MVWHHCVLVLLETQLLGGAMLLTITAVASFVIAVLIGTPSYVYLIIRNRIRPPIASWTCFLLATGISYFLYWQGPDPSLIGNPGQLAGFIGIAVVALTLAWKHLLRGELISSFTTSRTQRLTVVSATLILLVWMVAVQIGAGDPKSLAAYSFYATQALMILGYFGSVLHFTQLGENKDSLIMWGCIALSALVSVYPAWVTMDSLSMFNAVRGAFSGALSFGVFLGLDAANGRFTKET